MIYDFISNYEVNTLREIYELTSKHRKYDKVSNIYSRIILFNSSLNKEIKDYAKFGSNIKRQVFNLDDKEGIIKQKIKKTFNEELNINISENNIDIHKEDGDIKINIGDELNISIELKRRKCRIHDKNLNLKCSISSNNVYVYFNNYLGHGGYKKLVHDDDFYNKFIIEQKGAMERSGLIYGITDLNILPPGSFYINIKFTLKTPYISNDDVQFYIIDNPIKKEHIFKVPMVTASTWKGNLRWTMMKQLEMDNLEDEEFAERRFKLSLLFGTEKGIDEIKAVAKYMKMLRPSADAIYKNKLREYFNAIDAKFEGRLRFYPTYFDKIDLMVINPHNRVTKTGINPVYIECVPKGARGEFSLLYVPIDLIGRVNNKAIIEESKNDIELVSKGIRDMLYKYGFSAKKSSGFGIVERIESNDIDIKPEDLKNKIAKILCDNNEQDRS